MPEYSVETCLHWCDFVSYLWVPSNAYLLGQNVEVRKATLSIHRHDMIISTVFFWPNSQNVSEFIKIRQLRLKSWSWRIHYGQHCLETKSPFCLFDCVFSRLLYMVFSPYSSYRNSQSFDWIWKKAFHTQCIHWCVYAILPTAKSSFYFWLIAFIYDIFLPVSSRSLNSSLVSWLMANWNHWWLVLLAVKTVM